MDWIEWLRQYIGEWIVVDYTTNSGVDAWSKGILLGVDETAKKVIVRGNGNVWFIGEQSIVNAKIERGKAEARGEMSDL